MFKLILTLCSVLAVVKGESYHVAAYDVTPKNIDTFIKSVNVLFYKTIQSNEYALNSFEEQYSEQLNQVGSNIHVTTTIDEANERLNPLEVYNGHCRQCVGKYRHDIRTVEYVKDNVKKCVKNNYDRKLVDSAREIIQKLKDYIENTLKKDFNQCRNANINLNECASTVYSKALNFENKNQKDFYYNLKLAQCTAKANVKKALQCTFDVQTVATSGVVSANLKIDKCINPRPPQCQPCYPCGYTEVVKNSNEQITNPFRNTQQDQNCIMMVRAT